MRVDYTEGTTRLEVPQASKWRASKGKEDKEERQGMNDDATHTTDKPDTVSNISYPVTPPEKGTLGLFE